MLVLAGATVFVRAQAAEETTAQTLALEAAAPAEYNGDLRDLPPVYTPRPYLLLNEFEPTPNRKPKGMALEAPTGGDNLVALAPMPAPAKNFAGLGFNTAVTGGQTGSGWPPDTNGDVGPTVYIQAVNAAYGIFDKATGTRLAAFTENSLWSVAGTGTVCDTQNEGDPVVVHDAINDRWILTDFGFALSGGNPVGPFYECMAVSKSGDPVSGGWRFYAVRMDAGNVPADTFPDYPKFGLWGDGCLYMGANGFNNSTGSYAGPIFASFNTANLYAGTALTSSIGFLSNNSVFGMFPANLLGTSAGSLPPTGRTEFFVAESSTAFGFDVRKFTKGANCGAGGSLSTAATTVNQGSYGYPEVLISGKYTTNMVQQSGTTNRLDSLADEVMQRVVYRRIGSAESLWVVHTTCGSGRNADGACATTTSPAQPQWAQINVSGGTINTTPTQQQIYAPDSIKSRWMGSLAVDASGDMALGYSTSSSTAYPGIAYAGRLVGDTLNQLPQTEVVMQAGGGSETTYSRWGDYSSMSIDPADDCTFWYTTEYFAATGTNWQTRIGAFKFPSCVSSLPSKLEFTQQPSASYASGATITVKVSVENSAGDVVSADTSAITLALQGGSAGATLGGTATVNAVAGVATFTLSVNLVGTGYKLHATDGSLTVADSSTFNITAGAAKAVTFTTQPASNSNIAAGAAIPLVAHVTDAAGNAVSGQSITLAFGNNAGASNLSVSANPVTSNGSGDATFASVSLNKAGSGYTLRATDGTTPGATAALTNAFNIVAAAPAKLLFTTQPIDIAQGGTLNSVTVTEQDVNGNTMTGDHSTSIAFVVSACGGTSIGSAVVNGGVATLPGTQVFTQQHTGLDITANDPGLGLVVTSGTFTVGASDGIFVNGYEVCAL